METSAQSPATRVWTRKDFQSELKPIWCPGCGDFGVVSALSQALANVGVAPHNIAFLSGIGCSSRIPGYTTAYGFNSVHGRALPMALGVKLANPQLTVLAAGGDGDGFSIGGGHVPHMVRRNPDITYIVMDNHIYGLTKGQVSPTTTPGTVSATTPFGVQERPINPILFLLAYGCGYVAQGSAHDLKGLTQLIEGGIRYKGFAVINIESPCVTYGRDDEQIRVLRDRAIALESIGHNPADKMAAYAIAEQYGTTLHTGLLYQRDGLPEYNELQEQLRTQARSRGTYPRQDVFTRHFLVNA